MSQRWGGQRAQNLKAIVFREETHCWLCGGWVDQNAAYWLDAAKTSTNPAYRSVDHILPCKTHPWLMWSRANLRLCHLGCNQKRSAGVAKRIVPVAGVRTGEWPQSRQW